VGTGLASRRMNEGMASRRNTQQNTWTGGAEHRRHESKGNQGRWGGREKGKGLSHEKNRPQNHTRRDQRKNPSSLP